MSQPPYGEGFNQEYYADVGNYEVSTLEVRLPNRRNQFYWVVKGRGSMASGGRCSSRIDAAIAGVEVAKQKNLQDEARYQEYL
jgi:hypothetical protein